MAIEGNLIVATGEAKAGVFVRSESSKATGISVRNNDISVVGDGSWHSGIRVVATDAHGVGDITIATNGVKGAPQGILFEGRRYLNSPLCALNRMAADVATPIAGMERLPEGVLVVGGAASGAADAPQVGTGRFLLGRGNPNDNVTGQVGDIFQRLDGGPGQCLYVKESGGSGQTGWSAK